VLLLFAGVIEYDIVVGGDSEKSATVSVSLLDRDGNYVIRDFVGNQGNLQVPQARLWWPYLMDPDPAYLYTLEVNKLPFYMR
jgi:beta-glucuronidase